MKFNISKSSVAQNGFKLLPECIDKNGLDLETADNLKCIANYKSFENFILKSPSFQRRDFFSPRRDFSYRTRPISNSRTKKNVSRRNLQFFKNVSRLRSRYPYLIAWRQYDNDVETVFFGWEPAQADSAEFSSH